MADMELDGSGAPPAAVAKATDLSNADFCTKQKWVLLTFFVDKK